MIIVVAGIYRSGSTWLFNALRLLMEEEGLSPKSYFAGDYGYREEENAIVKAHSYYPELMADSDFIFTSIRKKADIRKSMEEVNKRGVAKDYENAGNPEGIDQYWEWLITWNRNSNYMMNFEDMITDKELVLNDLKNITGFKGNVLDKLNELTAPKVGHDPVTFLGETHFNI